MAKVGKRNLSRLLCVIAVGSLLLSVAGPASASQDTAKIAYRLLDYAKDVNHGFTINRTDQHAEVDLIEVASALDGSNVRFSMKVRGAIVADNDSYEYSWRVCFEVVDYARPEGCSDVVVKFSNGTATFRESGDPVDVAVVSSAGSALTVTAPLALFANFTEGWELTAEAEYDLEGYWFDNADLDVGGGALLPQDISGDGTPFTSPAVAITSVLVQGSGTPFRVTVVGTTSGGVDELRVAIGDKTSFGGFTTWSWRGWWREENKSAGDSNASLEKVGGSWFQWKFTLDYDPSSYSLGIISETKIEVRAVGSDGSWGHKNQTCACGTSSGPIPPDNTGGNGNNQNNTTTPPPPSKGFLPGFEVAAAASGLGLAAAVAVRRRK